MAIFEGVYAYLFKKNYASDNISLGEGIYTLTADMGSAEIKELQLAFRAHGDLRLDKIDGSVGVTQNGNPTPNYGLSAFSYTPVNGNKIILSRITLRASIKNLPLRGTKALIHAIVADGLPRDVYAVDCTYNRLFDEYIDIPLEEKMDDLEFVCEKRPQELAVIDASRFVSNPICARDISDLGANAFKKLSATVAAIIAAKRDGKTLFIVHNIEENDFVRLMLRMALKVLPVAIANSVSFATASGATGGVARNVMCIPTCDDATIADFKRMGYVVELHEGGVIPADVKSGEFCEFFANATEDDVQKFLDCMPIYYEHVRKLDDLDVIMRLFINKYITRREERSGQKPTEEVNAKIKLIADNFALISNIRGELTEQLTGLSSPIDMLVGEFFSASPDEVLSTVLLPLVDLYKACKVAGVSVSTDIMGYIYQVLFGYAGQSTDCEQKHFRLLTNFSRLANALGDNFKELIEQMNDDVEFLRRFFTDFFTDGDYTETASRISYEILRLALADVQSRYGREAALRDMLVEKYSDSANTYKMNDLYALIFRPATDIRDTFDYIANVVFADRSDAARHNDRLVAYGAFLCNPKYIGSAIKYYCEAVAGGQKADDARTVLNELLGSYISRSNGSLDGIYSQFTLLVQLIEEIRATQGLKVQLYDDFATRVINPDYEKAIASVNADALTDEQKNYCQTLIREFGKGTLCSTVNAKFSAELASLIDRHERFVAQSDLEGKLTGAREDFIVRELLLLDGKTVHKLLTKYAKDICNRVYGEYNLGSLAPYKKSQEFIAASEKIAREYLCASDSAKSREANTTSSEGFSLKASRTNKGKDAFISEIKRERDDRNVDFRIHLADASRRFLESVFVSGIMFLIAVLASFALYKFYEGGYFVSVYVSFPIIAVVVSQILYWYNFEKNKTRSTFLMTMWQSLVVTVAMIGIFALVRITLLNIY